MKKIILLAGVIISFIISHQHIFAEETPSPQIEVDLFVPETQNIQYLNTEGIEIQLIVEPLNNQGTTLDRNKVYTLQNLNPGSYKISKRAKGSWATTYTVTINSNKKFTGAKNMNINVLKGSVSNQNLTISSSKVIGTFRYKYGIITTTPSITTTINANKLVVK